MPENQPKSGLIGLINKLPKFMQRQLLGIGFLQRMETYITDLPGMLPMLDEHNNQTPELIAELIQRGIGKAQSVFIDIDGVLLHALYLPPTNGKLICAFHGIKGNWLNNPPALNPGSEDTDYNPRYRMLLLEEFARDGFGFLAFTLPGFNPSQGTASEANFAKACDAFADYTKDLALKSGIPAQDIIICGESLGGAAAAIFAAKLTEKGFPPSVVSLIASFDSLISMTQNEFPIFTKDELTNALSDQLDTTKTLRALDRKKTWIHIVAAEGDTIIPIQNTMNLLEAARGLGFNVLYHPTPGKHTTWDTKTVVSGKKITHMAREKGIEIAEHQTVLDIEGMIAALDNKE